MSDERGMVGKLAVIWLVLAAVIVIGLVDGASVLVTRLHLSDIAGQAAIAGSGDYQSSHDVQHACAAAGASIQAADPSLKLGKAFCTVDTTKGNVTISLHKEANTIVLGRLSFTKHYAMVKDSETNGPSSV